MKPAEKIGIDSIIDILKWLETCQLINILESNPKIILSKIHQFLSNRSGPNRTTRSSNRTQELDSEGNVHANRCPTGEDNDNGESNAKSVDNQNRRKLNVPCTTRNPTVVLHRLEDITWRQTESGKLIGDETLMNCRTRIIRKTICVSLESCSNLKINNFEDPVEVKTDDADIELEYNNEMRSFERMPDDESIEIKDETSSAMSNPATVTMSEPTNAEVYDDNPDPGFEIESDDDSNFDIAASHLPIPNRRAVGGVTNNGVDSHSHEQSRDNISKANSTTPNSCTEKENPALEKSDKPDSLQSPPKIIRKTIGVGDMINMMINRLYEVDEVEAIQNFQDTAQKPQEMDARVNSSSMDDGSAEIIDIFDPIQAPDIPASTSTTVCAPNQPPKKIEKSFTCAECGKIFSGKNGKQIWRNHMITHQNLRNFVCRFCPKAFNFKSQLTAHELIHTEEPCLCEQCPKTFATPGLLKAHIKFVHCDVKPFVCSICDKRFPGGAQLRSHSVRHSEERPLNCKLCPMTFKRANILTNHHHRVHTGEKPHKCNMCEKGFVTSGELSKHKQRNHK